MSTTRIASTPPTPPDSVRDSLTCTIPGVPPLPVYPTLAARSELATPVAIGSEQCLGDPDGTLIEHRLALMFAPDEAEASCHFAIERGARRPSERRVAAYRAAYGRLSAALEQERWRASDAHAPDEVVLAELYAVELPIAWMRFPDGGFEFTCREHDGPFPRAEHGRVIDALVRREAVPRLAAGSSVLVVGQVRVRPAVEAVGATEVLVGAALRWWGRGPQNLVVVVPSTEPQDRRAPESDLLPPGLWAEVAAAFGLREGPTSAPGTPGAPSYPSYWTATGPDWRAERPWPVAAPDAGA